MPARESPRFPAKGVGMTQSVSSYIAGFFTSRGRLGRLEFFVRTLIVLVLVLANFAVVPQAMEADVPFLQWVPLGLVVIGLFSLFFLVARRLQDININGWWVLLFLVFNFTLPPVIIVLFFVPGSKGDNRYGPGPGANNPIEPEERERQCKP